MPPDVASPLPAFTHLAKKDLEQSLDEEDEQDMGRDRVKEGEE